MSKRSFRTDIADVARTINLRHAKDMQVSVTARVVLLVILNIEIFIFFSGSQDGDKTVCENVVSVIYPSSNSTSNAIVSLLSKWKSSPQDVYTILSVPRKAKNGIIIVIPFTEYENNINFRNLFETISSISKHTKESEKFVNNVLILFYSNFKYHGIIQKILMDFSADVQIGFLQLIKIPLLRNDSILFAQQSILSDVAKNAKKNETCKFLDVVSAAFPYLATRGSFVWFVDHDVEILGDNFLSEALRFINKMTKPWSIIDFSDHLSGYFTGKLIRVGDVNKFAYFFVHLFSQTSFKESQKRLYEAHLDYLHLMYQSNFVTYRPSLMIRRSQAFQVDVQKFNRSLFDYFTKGKWRSNDPSGVIVTNMRPRDFEHSPMRAYGSLPNQYFEAVMPRHGEWFAVVFDENVYLEKVILELDYRNATSEAESSKDSDLEKPGGGASFNGSKSDSLVKGMLEASPKLLKLDVQKNLLTCADYIFLGNVVGETTVADELQDKLYGRPTKCLKFTLSSLSPLLSFKIKQIAVFASE